MQVPMIRPRIELALAGLVFAAFLGINLLTAARSPIVWQDEVMFADPAVNLYQGNGFTSTAWGQPRESFFAGNSPLYSMLLYPWIRTFGVGAVSVRSLNYVLMICVVTLSWLALHRLGQVGAGSGRMLFAALVFCGDGVTFSYRSGRYDCLGMAIAAGLLAALSIERPRLRFAILVLLATLVPWAGLQLIPYTATLGVVLLIVRGRRSIRELAAVVVGGMLGAVSLIAFFKFNGVWPDFLNSIRLLAGAPRTILGRLGQMPTAPLVEPSAVLLLVALALLWISSLRRGLPLRSPASLARFARPLRSPASLARFGGPPPWIERSVRVGVRGEIRAVLLLDGVHPDGGRAGGASRKSSDG